MDEMDQAGRAPARGPEDGDGPGGGHGDCVPHGGDTNPQLEPEDGNGQFYRLGTNQSSASIFEDVEMAHDEVSRSCTCGLDEVLAAYSLQVINTNAHPLAVVCRPHGGVSPHERLSI
jgi:hypothetical protein